MGYALKPGTLIAGFRVAQRLGLKPKTPLAISGQNFVVERCLAESGTEEDIRLYTSLADAQRLLGLPGRISEIQAIDCLCLTADQDPLSRLRAELEEALPEATVIQLRTLADTRAKQRQTAERYFAKASPFLLIVCAGWVALLATLNARERRLELGVLHALGRSPAHLAALFLARASLLGVLAAAVGWLVGTVVALRVGPDIFRVTAGAITADLTLLGYALVAAPLFTCLATVLPTLHAVTLDPAVILREA
jgi:putative ABC transport system permease protein